MQMQKGICMELNDDRSIFILKDGRFVEGQPADAAAVGEEAYFYPKVKKAKSRARTIWTPLILAAAIVTLILSVALPSNEAYAYVQIEVNPSIELGVDEEYRVIALRELNEDGAEIVSKIGQWENHSLDKVLEKVILLSLKDTTEEVTITTVFTGEESGETEGIEKMVLAVSAKVVKENLEVHLKEATPEQWQKSIEDNVPVGRKVENFKRIEEPAQKNEESDAIKPNRQKENGNTLEEKKSTPPPVQENKTIAPGQEKKKATPPGQEKKKVTPPGQEKKTTAPGQEKKKATPPGQEKKTIAPGQEKKKANPPPGQERKNKEPGQEKNKKTPPGQDKKYDNRNDDKGHKGNNGNNDKNGKQNHKGHHNDKNDNSKKSKNGKE